VGKVVKLVQTSREQERDNCIHYMECLTDACIKDAPFLPCLNCARYQEAVTVPKQRTGKLVKYRRRKPKPREPMK
jgi:hypothetical protein